MTMNPYDDEDTVDELPAPPRKMIPASDRELLDLAARALGARFAEVDGEGYGNLHFADGEVVNAWNPKQFSGDSFELVAALELDVIHRVVGGRRIEVLAAGGPLIKHFYEGETSTAMRDAVLIAAAELGKRKQA